MQCCQVASRLHNCLAMRFPTSAGLSFSLAGNTDASKPPSSLPAHKSTNGVKRPHAALHDESDDEDDSKKESVTHFGSSGAFDVLNPKVEKQPLIIQAQANRDWKEASKENKRAKYGMPSEDQRRDTASRKAQIREIESRNKPTYGLNTFERKETEERAAEGETHARAESPLEKQKDAELPQTRTDDERAMDALLGQKAVSDMTIPAAAVTEEEAFQRDFHTAPDMATLDEYKAVPVEEFGAALLRGMGWKEGQGIGNQKGQKFERAKVPERRPALLGIGAKADAAVAEEMGAWGRGSKAGARRKEPLVYNPLVMRNKKTGAEFTEDELRERLKEQKDEDSNRAAEYQRKQQDKERRRDRERDGSRRAKYDDDSDEEYARRRRERRREKERDGEHYSSTRDRGGSHDSDKRRANRDEDGRHRERRREKDERDHHRSRRDYEHEGRNRDHDRDRDRDRDRDKDSRRYRR